MHSRALHKAWSCLVKVSPFKPFSGREAFSPPEFPGYPRKQMTRSQTPVVTPMLAILTAHQGLLSSSACRLSTFHWSLHNQLYPMTTTIHISGLYTDPPFLIHLASNSRHRVCPQVSLLPYWLGFWQVGLAPNCGTHPLGNINQFHLNT